MKKPVRIIVIIALTLCAVLLVTVIAVTSGGGLAGGNKDSRYPYSWKLKVDGTVDFTMTAQKVDGYTWQTEELPIYTGIAMSPLEQAGDKIKFSITPLSGGLYNIRLNCNNTDGLTDMSFNITVVVETDLTISTVMVSETDYYVDAVGEAENCKYSVHTSDESDLEIRFSYLNEGSYAWSDAGDENDMLQLNSVESAVGTSVVRIFTTEYLEKQQKEIDIQNEIESQVTAEQSSIDQGDEDEPAVVTTYTANLYGVDSQQKQDLQLSITFEYSSGKVTKITSHTIQAVPHVTKAEALTEEKAQLEKHIGKEIKTIENSKNWQFAIGGTEKDKNQSAFFAFELDGNNYEYTMMKSESLADPTKGTRTTWEKGSGKDAAKAPFTSYTADDTIMLVWNASDGVVCTLVSAKGIGIEKLQAVANELQ